MATGKIVFLTQDEILNIKLALNMALERNRFIGNPFEREDEFSELSEEQWQQLCVIHDGFYDCLKAIERAEDRPNTLIEFPTVKVKAEPRW